MALIYKWCVKDKLNNFTIDHKDLMPMVGDIIKFEYFLTMEQ